VTRLAPALAVLAVFAAALGALFRWSVLEFVPGSLQTGGLTLANFRAVLAPQYLGAIRDTVVLSALTTVLTLVAAYPVAYALARTPSRRVRSLILVLTLAPFFTGPSYVPTRGCWCSATPSSPGRCRCSSPSAACWSDWCTSRCRR